MVFKDTCGFLHAYKDGSSEQNDSEGGEEFIF